MAGDDVVHFDFHPGNVLVAPEDPSQIVAIVDWDGCGAGNVGLDLTTLCFSVTAGYERSPGVDSRLRSLVDALPDDVRRPCWAHMSLRLVDWAIRFHPDEVDHWLALAATGMD